MSVQPDEQSHDLGIQRVLLDKKNRIAIWLGVFLFWVPRQPERVRPKRKRATPILARVGILPQAQPRSNKGKGRGAIVPEFKHRSLSALRTIHCWDISPYLE